MQLTITLPDHVAAAWPDADTAAAWLLAAATDYARSQAAAAASDQAQQVIRAALEPFDGPPSEVPTVAQRVADLEDATALIASEFLGGAA